MKIDLHKMNFFGQGTFFMNNDFKNGCKNEFKGNDKNHAGDPEIAFLTNSIFKPYGCTTAMPTVWELIIK